MCICLGLLIFLNVEWSYKLVKIYERLWQTRVKMNLHPNVSVVIWKHLTSILDEWDVYSLK